jgi:hypothetical protein
MTDPFDTGTKIFVVSPTHMGWHNLVTDRRLPLLPDTHRRRARLHEDPNTAMTTSVLVMLTDDETFGYLAPNAEQCPLCTRQGAITVRQGSLARNEKGEIEIPWEILDAVLRGETPPEMPHDDVIDVSKPCPLCRSIDYALVMDDEIGCI